MCEFCPSDGGRCGVCGNPDDAAFIRNPDDWPVWPYLPVKKSGRVELGIDNKTIGILCCTDELVNKGQPTVYHVYLFDLPKKGALKDAPKTDYPTVEAMLADGWVVD